MEATQIILLVVGIIVILTGISGIANKTQDGLLGLLMYSEYSSNRSVGN